MYKKYIAVDQYGNKLFVDHPRKDLLEFHGVQHADKMYRDGKDGETVHVGYIVQGRWYEVMKLSALHSA